MTAHRCARTQHGEGVARLHGSGGDMLHRSEPGQVLCAVHRAAGGVAPGHAGRPRGAERCVDACASTLPPTLPNSMPMPPPATLTHATLTHAEKQQGEVNRLICNPDALQLPEASLDVLAGCPKLTFLILTSQWSEVTQSQPAPACWEQLPRLLARLPGLACIDISNCGATDAGEPARSGGARPRHHLIPSPPGSLAAGRPASHRSPLPPSPPPPPHTSLVPLATAQSCRPSAPAAAA
jgi:hypothetical protein